MSVPSALSDPPGEQERNRRPLSTYLRAFGRVRQRMAASASPEAMTVLQHLEELRIRIFKAGIALAVTTAFSFLYSTQLVDFLTAPVGGRAALASIEVTENISVFMRVALLAGASLGLPFVLHQAIAYAAPGLKPRERRWLYTLLPAATVFFLGGVAFAWFVMIPITMPFLLDFLGIPTRPRPLNYISFVTSLLFWVGVSFEMPLVIFFFAKLKWVTARQLIRGWRYAFMAMATVAAVVTPTVDAVNMALVMLPLLALYLVSIALAWIA